MRNTDKIAMVRYQLMNEDTLAEYDKIEIADAIGKRFINIPEEIYTLNAWRARGRDVPVDEKPVAIIPIWIKKANSRGQMILTKAKFFKYSQTVEWKGGE